MKPLWIVLLFHLEAFEDFNVCLLYLLWYFDYHLLVYFAKALLAGGLLGEQCCFDYYVLKAWALVEGFVGYLDNVYSNRYLFDLFVVLESVCSDFYYLVANSIYCDCVWNCDGFCLRVCFAKADCKSSF